MAGPQTAHALETSLVPEVQGGLDVARHPLLKLQKQVGNRNVGKLMRAGTVTGKGELHLPGGRAIDSAPQPRATAANSIQRYSWDEFVGDAEAVGSAAVEGAKEAGAAVVSGAEAVGSAAVSGAEAVGAAVVSGAQAIGSAVVSGAEQIGSAVSTGLHDLGAAASSAADWVVTEAGQLALAAANELAGLVGGTVTVGPDGLIIEIPEIDLLDSETIPIIPAVDSEYIPILEAGAEIGPVILVGSLGVQVTPPSVTGVLGPGAIRNIRVRIDPAKDTYSAEGQLYIGAAITEVMDIAPAIRGDAITVIPSDPPIPLDAAVEGGLRLTVRASALGSLADTVKLAYSSGTLSLDQNFTLKIGPLVEADLDAYIDIFIETVKICEWSWPLEHWEESEAEQYDLPLSVSLGSGKGTVTTGPVTSKPIPISDIETRLSRKRPEPAGCKDIEDIWRELCKTGKLPPEVCPENKGAGPPGVVPIVPVVPPLVPAAAQAPTGTRSDPIPMKWAKPPGKYKNPISLDGGQYKRNERKRLTRINRWIGVSSWPGKGTLLHRVSTPRGGEADAFKKALEDEGFEWDAWSPDHVVDLFFEGPDSFTNLWPLDRDTNQFAGTWHPGQGVDFSDGPGTPNQHQAIGSTLLNGRWFKIDEVVYPP